MSKFKLYLDLAKPGIIMGNAITCAGGFFLASKGSLEILCFISTLIGLSSIVASGCVSNNYIDRDHDQKMTRTKDRALAKREISPKAALIYAGFLLLLGSLVLGILVNILSLLTALFGLIVYLIFYSFSKYKTVYATLIGSIAGAIPPVVGYCGISNQIDLGAVLIFLIIALWQMPHFYAIALFRFKEYAAASIPVFPVVRGVEKTKNHILFYILLFIGASLMLPLLKYTGHAYTIVAFLLGTAWIVFCLQGFKSENSEKWAKKMFLFSLVVVLGICGIIPFSVS